MSKKFWLSTINSLWDKENFYPFSLVGLFEHDVIPIGCKTNIDCFPNQYEINLHHHLDKHDVWNKGEYVARCMRLEKLDRVTYKSPKMSFKHYRLLVRRNLFQKKLLEAYL